MVNFRAMSGIFGRAIKATTTGETQRHGTLWTIKQWKRLAHLYAVRAMCAILRHTGSKISDVDPHGTTRGHPACIAVRRLEQREEEQKESVGTRNPRVFGSSEPTPKSLCVVVKRRASQLEPQSWGVQGARTDDTAVNIPTCRALCRLPRPLT